MPVAKYEGVKLGNVVLTADTFESMVIKGRHNWMISFTSGDAVAESWDTAAKNLKGMVRFGSIDITAASELASRYGIAATGAVKSFTPGDSEPKSFDGDITSATALTDAANALLSSEYITSLDTMQAVSTFMQHEPQSSRIVLFSDKPTSPALLKSLATYFAGEVFVGFVPNARANVEVSKSFQVDTYPTFILIQGPIHFDQGIITYHTQP